MQTHLPLWLLPGALATLFAGVAAFWAHGNDQLEQVAFQQMLAMDATTIQAQLAARQEAEQARLADLAEKLRASNAAPEAALASDPATIAGLDRLWNRVVWLNEDNQVVARADRRAPGLSDSSNGPAGTASPLGDMLQIRNPGQAVHLAATLNARDGHSPGRLLARYDLTDLLQSTDLGWLTRRYEVNFLSELGEVIATTAKTNVPARGAPYEKPLDTFSGTTLRLTPLDVPTVWWQSARMVVLLIALVLLGLGASAWLRREMARVQRAMTDARTEASWRQAMEDSSLVGLRARDLQGRILYVNKTLCHMVGYTRDELVGLTPPLPFWPSQSVEELMAHNRATLSGAAPTEGFEARWVHRDGRLLDVVVYESALIDAYGKQFGWMGSIVDISQRKALEERDRRHVEAMAQHARLNDLGLIASELAHELNQPLASIASYSAGLQIALRKEAVQGDVLQAVDEVNRSARKAGDIVNWIRRQSSRSAPQRQWVDVNLLVTEVVNHRRASLLRQGIVVQLNLQEGLPRASLDAVGIEQIVGNLLRNAAEAVEAGTMAGDSTRLRRIDIRTAPVPSAPGEVAAVQIAVRDSGPGLQGRTIETLCSTFYSTKESGMGLGLGICRSIAESHGGTLTAGDADGGGAEFVVTLPAGQEAP